MYQVITITIAFCRCFEQTMYSKYYACLIHSLKFSVVEFTLSNNFMKFEDTLYIFIKIPAQQSHPCLSATVYKDFIVCHLV